MQNGKWANSGVPKAGWEFAGMVDLGDPSAICEMCEVQEIRYVHYMDHWDYPDTLRCGVICAGRMGGDAAAARARDDEMRRQATRAARKGKWLGRNWRESAAGNAFLNTGGFNVVVYERGYDVWGFRVLNRTTDDRIVARKLYASQEAAMLRAFDALERMKDKGR